MCYRGRRRPSFVFTIFKVGRFQKCPQTPIRGVSRINASTSVSSTNISPNLEQLVTPLINKDEQDSSEYIYSEDEQEEDAEDNLKEDKVLTALKRIRVYSGWMYKKKMKKFNTIKHTVFCILYYTKFIYITFFALSMYQQLTIHFRLY